MYGLMLEQPRVDEEVGYLLLDPRPAGLRDLIAADLLEIDPPRPDRYAWSDLHPEWRLRAGARAS